MKILRLRFVVFCLVVFCFVCVPITKPVLHCNYEEKTTYYFYTNYINSDIKNSTVLKNGNYNIVACNIEYAEAVKDKLNDIYGESVRISNYRTKTLQEILNKYINYCVKFEEFGNYKSLLCYDSSLSNYVVIDTQRVNMQIAYDSNEINIGYPLILNGF